MLDHEYQAIISKASREVAEGLKPLLQELEENNDRLQGELRQARTKIALLQERPAELVARPKSHMHDPDDPNPVLVFDLDHTLRDTATYPMTGPPYPNVKAALDQFALKGCCLHLATGGLYYGSEDLDLYRVRWTQIQSWLARHGIPIDCLLPKVVADCYYDDRMVNIPDDPDWLAIAGEAEQALSKRFDLVDGLWVRKPKNKTGREITDWPNYDDVPQDAPRGYSGPKLDVDYHRTLSQASSSLREAEPQAGAVQAIKDLYGQGVTIQLSCAGWNPADHKRDDSRRRVAALRKWAIENEIPYDRIVAKDHGDLYFDDKGVRATGDWAADMPGIQAMLQRYGGNEEPTEDEYEPAEDPGRRLAFAAPSADQSPPETSR